MKIYRLLFIALMVCVAPLRVTWAGSAAEEGAEPQTAHNYSGLPYPEEIKREACLECHGQVELKSVTERGAGLDIHIPEHQFDRSVHSEVECVLCHSPKATKEDFADTPHNLDPETVPSCMNCHDSTFEHVKQEIAESWHFEKQGSDITCIDCHNPHTDQKVTVMDSYSASVAGSNKVCMDCHSSAIKYKELTGEEVYTQDLSHEFLPNRDEHFNSVRCIECHTPYEGELKKHTILSKEEALSDCTACHTEEDSLIVARIQGYTDIQQGGGSFLGKGHFDDSELIDKMKSAGIDFSNTGKIVTRIVPEEEVIQSFADAYVPGIGQTSLWDSRTNSVLLAILAVLALHAGARVMLSPKPKGNDVKGDKIYPVTIRLSHSVNAVLFVILLATGFSTHYPDATLSLPMELSSGIHNVAGILLTINFAIFILFNLLTGGIKQYLPFKAGGMDSFNKQLHYYLIGMFRGDEKPHHATAKQRMNPVQQLTYLVVYCLGMFVMLASGFLLFVPELAEAYLPGVATRSLATVHFLLATGYLAFLMLHLYMITTGKRPTSLLKGMATGHHYD